MRNLDGLLIIDKPEGITSHDVVDRVRRILHTRRVGHTGTLDPFATGVMVLVIGKATRLAQFLNADEKEYEAAIKFGFETDSGDRTGTPRSPVHPDPRSILDAVDWNEALAVFQGEIVQLPPMYSAKKVDGKKLYEHAREGVDIERSSVNVVIKALEIIDANKLYSSEPILRIRVLCSAGTYIRTLAEDIGRKVGVGAHLAELRRTNSGRFSCSDAVTLDELANMPDPSAALRVLDDAVRHLPVMVLPHDRIEKTLNGLSTRCLEKVFVDGAAIRMVDDEGQLVAIGVYDSLEESVRPRTVLI